MNKEKETIEVALKAKYEEAQMKQKELERLKEMANKRIGKESKTTVIIEEKSDGKYADIVSVRFPREKFQFINKFENNISPVKSLIDQSNIKIEIRRKIETTEEARKYLTKAFEALNKDPRFVMADNTTPLFG